MHFEINLPPRMDVYLLRGAGVEPQPYLEITTDSKFILGKAPPPTNLPCPYFLSDKPVRVRLTQLADNPKHCRLRIEVDDVTIGKRIREYLTRYSLENDGGNRIDRERKDRWKKIETILKRDNLSYDKLGERGRLLTRRAIEALMQLCAETPHPGKGDVRDLLTENTVPKSERLLTVEWLIHQFENERDPFERDQLSLRIWENAIPQVADELIRLLKDKRLGASRAFLSLALAKTKHRCAAEAIAAVLREQDMAYAGIQALAKLNAKQHADLIKEFMRDPDADVRREAKKALKRFGMPTEATPPPKHLIKNSTRIPHPLEEWSGSLDLEQLEPMLEKLSRLVDGGFGKTEIAETIAVAEEMKLDQTRAFRFPIKFEKKKTELFVGIFMDDFNSPDLEIHTTPALTKQFSAAIDLEESA